MNVKGASRWPPAPTRIVKPVTTMREHAAGMRRECGQLDQIILDLAAGVETLATSHAKD